MARSPSFGRATDNDDGHEAVVDIDVDFRRVVIDGRSRQQLPKRRETQ
jgi:hypothetical protein